jgi:hypothetical protein
MKLFKDSKNNIFAYEADGSQDHLIQGKTSISQAQADEIHAKKAKEKFDALTAQEKRQLEYPSFADQFDTLYHGGYDAWKAMIDVVKNKYPKA